MFEMFRDWMETRHQEQELARAQMSAQIAQFKQLEEASNIVTERPDSGGWARGMAKVDNNALLPADRSSMVQQARQMFRFDPNARGALCTLVYYVIGEGVKITPQSTDPRIHRLWREFWNSSRNRMALRQAEIILRTFRDGEAFLQVHRTGLDGLPTWKTTVRFRDPELLKTPPDGSGASDATDGIRTQANDPETPVVYYFSSGYAPNSPVDIVQADDIIHLKIFADSEQKRGETYILAAMENFTQYKEWLRYRIILNKVRTAFVMIKKITGGSGDVMAIQSTMGSAKTARSGETRKRIPPPGTVVTANQGVEYDFKSANINAGDAAEDGRSMKLSMAAGTNMPEYVFGDASNANYASTLIAESPFVKGIRFWQTFFEFHFKELFKQVVRSAVNAGKLTPPAEDEIFAEPGSAGLAEAGTAGQGKKKGNAAPDTHELSETEAFWGCDVQWPEVVHREIDKTTSAVVGMVNAKLISESTGSSILGYDYEEEMRKQQLIEDGAETNPFKNAGLDAMDQGDGEVSAEMKDLMGSLTPDESDQIMKASDPQAVMDLIVKKRKAAASA